MYIILYNQLITIYYMCESLISHNKISPLVEYVSYIK